MNGHLSDNEFENLINEGDLSLDAVDEPAVPAPAAAPAPDLSFFGKIPVNVTLEVASAEISLKELMECDTSSVIVLDKLAGEPLDVKVNGTLFAKAEVVVMNGNYGLRIVELSGTSRTPSPHEPASRPEPARPAADRADAPGSPGRRRRDHAVQPERYRERPEFSVKLQILIIMTLLGFLPAMLMMMTCFTRFIIVLAILRRPSACSRARRIKC